MIIVTTPIEKILIRGTYVTINPAVILLKAIIDQACGFGAIGRIIAGVIDMIDLPAAKNIKIGLSGTNENKDYI